MKLKRTDRLNAILLKSPKDSQNLYSSFHMNMSVDEYIERGRIMGQDLSWLLELDFQHNQTLTERGMTTSFFKQVDGLGSVVLIDEIV